MLIIALHGAQLALKEIWGITLIIIWIFLP